jgi:hypothetical protein
MSTHRNENASVNDACINKQQCNAMGIQLHAQRQVQRKKALKTIGWWL